MQRMAASMPRFSRPPSLVILVLVGWLVLVSLPLVSTAPNRLLSGQGQSLWQVLETAGALWQASILVLAVTIFICLAGLCLRPWQNCCSALILVFLVFAVWGLTALSGQFAATASAQTDGLGRITLSGGFWLMVL